MSARTHAHILIIEDDPGIATSLRSGLEREGYQVTCKDHGEEGIAFAQTQSPEHWSLFDYNFARVKIYSSSDI